MQATQRRYHPEPDFCLVRDLLVETFPHYLALSNWRIEAVRRVAALGAQSAWVGSTQPFSLALEFQPRGLSYKWRQGGGVKARSSPSPEAGT